MAKLECGFFHRYRLNRSSEETHPYSEFKINTAALIPDFQWAAGVLKIILNLGFRFKDYERLWKCLQAMI